MDLKTHQKQQTPITLSKEIKSYTPYLCYNVFIIPFGLIVTISLKLVGQQSVNSFTDL